MTDVAARRFIERFQQAFAAGGRVSAADLRELQGAHRQIQDETLGKAAAGILAFLKHDKELDSFETAPVRKALRVLLGEPSTARLPAELERVLARAVPQANVDVKLYDLNFDLSAGDNATSYPARARITLEKPLGAVGILEVDPTRIGVTSVKAAGKDVPFRLVDGRLHVDARGATDLDISYDLKPVDVRGDAGANYGLIRDKYTGRTWTLTWPYNTGALFPSNSAPADGVTARVNVHVGADRQVVGSGTRTADGFVVGKPVPAYSLAFYTAKAFEHDHAGHSHGGVEVLGYGMEDRVPPAVREAYRKEARQSLDFFASWLGPFAYGKTLSLVEVEGALGGMEHTAAVAMMMGAARHPRESRETAVHETAHHWFGDNLRIKSWGDFWMSEGFTNYATYRYFRKAEGESAYHRMLDDARAAVTSTLDENPHALSAPEHTDVNEIFDSIPYEMGPWILRMMEVRVGTGKFDALLKDWFTSRQGTAVSTDEFVAFARAKTGVDFAPFFQQWNNITTVPTFKPLFEQDGTHALVELQAQGPFPRGMTVPLRLHGANGQSMTVDVVPGKRQQVEVPFKVTRREWDPDRTVLASVR